MIDKLITVKEAKVYAKILHYYREDSFMNCRDFAGTKRKAAIWQHDSMSVYKTRVCENVLVGLCCN